MLTTSAVSTLPEPSAAPASRSESNRDPILDVARAGALVVVVLWHWVFSTVRFEADGPHVGNPINSTPMLWLSTWFLQVMPLFFLVGGAVHASALASRGAEGFVARRLRRLVLPALPLVVPAVVLWSAAMAAGHVAVANTLVLLVSPLWFAATYAVLVTIAPAAWRAQTRHPVLTPTMLLAAVVAIDLLRFSAGWSHPAFVLLTFVVVWTAVHQLGFAWSWLRSAPTSTKAVVAVVGYLGLAVAVVFGPYPPSMVGVPGEATSNMGPPDLAVVFLGTGQLGLLALAADRLVAFARRHRAVVDAAASWSMTIFVWHLLAWGIAYGVLRAAGVDVPGSVSTEWWMQRPLWLLAPAAVAIPLCRAARRFDR